MEPVRPESIQNVLEELYGAVKAKTGAETHVVAVDLVRSQKKLMVYQHGDYERKLFDDESTPISNIITRILLRRIQKYMIISHQN